MSFAPTVRSLPQRKSRPSDLRFAASLVRQGHPRRGRRMPSPLKMSGLQQGRAQRMKWHLRPGVLSPNFVMAWCHDPASIGLRFFSLCSCGRLTRCVRHSIRNQHRRNQKSDRADDPHDGSRSGLVFARRESEDARSAQSTRDRARDRQTPAWPTARYSADRQRADRAPLPNAATARLARPRLDHRPPEDQRGDEKTGVFELMPRGRPHRQLIQSGHVPAQHDDRPSARERIQAASTTGPGAAPVSS